MPLYKTITPNSQTTVKIWKITEAFDSLLKPLSLNDESFERVSHMKSDIHRRGFLSVRHLLRAFGYTDRDLFYDECGKPHLKDGKFISITHSFTYSAIIISDGHVGIDIEKQRPKIQGIASKFIGYESQYINAFNNDYIKELTTIWCVKESLYKLFATNGLSFKKHTMVIPFILKDEQTVAWINYESTKKKYNAHFFEFDGFSCAYVI